MTNSETIGNAHENKQVPVWKNKSFWHITILIMVCSVFYYMDVIINFGGWVNLKWKIFYTVHDLHRALFLIPVMYATYEFRLKGIIVTSLLSLLVFLPRALIVSPYPDPLLRALIFMISMVIMGVLLSKLLNNISERKKLKQDLSQAQNDLLRKRSEEALRESEDRYKSLIDNIPDIIFTIDLEGKITFVSKRAKEILGYENEETINMNIFNFIPEEDHQRAIENLQKGMKGEKIRHFQIPMITKSGESLIFECSFARVYKDGKVVGAQGTAVDITERKQLDDQLFESLVKLQLTIDEAPVCVAMIGTDKRFLQCNKSFCDFLGYSDEELKGKTIAEITFPEDMEVGMADLRAIVADEKKTSRVQKRYVRKDGRVVWGEVTISLIRDKHGNPIYFLPIIQDITERKLVEEELLESEQKFHEIVRTLDEGYYSVTLDGVLLEHNHSFSRILGFDQAADLKGKQMPDFWQNPDERNVYLQEFFAKGFISNYQINARTKTGEKITVIISAHLVKDKDNMPLRIEGIVLDITKNKKAQDELQASEARLRAILDATPFPIALADVQDNIIEYWSRSALELFGHTAPTTPEWYELAYPDPEYRREVIERWKPFLKTARHSGKPVNTGEYRVSCHDGSARICELYATFLSDKLIVTFNDITARKMIEKALITTEEQLKEAHRLAHIGIWSWIAKTDTVTWSEDLYHIAGLDPMLPAPAYAEHDKIYAPESLILLKDAVGRALKTGETYQIELKLIRPDGTTRWTKAFGGPMYGSKGKITGLHGTLLDITDIKMADEEIRRLNESLERQVNERTVKLKETIALLEETNRAFIGRELRMIELKEQIAELEKRLQR